MRSIQNDFLWLSKLLHLQEFGGMGTNIGNIVMSYVLCFLVDNLYWCGQWWRGQYTTTVERTWHLSRGSCVHYCCVKWKMCSRTMFPSCVTSDPSLVSWNRAHYLLWGILTFVTPSPPCHNRQLFIGYLKAQFSPIHCFGVSSPWNSLGLFSS